MGVRPDVKLLIALLVLCSIAAACGSSDLGATSWSIRYEEVGVTVEPAARERGVAHISETDAGELLARDVELGDDRALVAVHDVGSSSCPPGRLIRIEAEGDTVVAVREVTPQDRVCTADVVSWVTILSFDCDDVAGLVGVDGEPLADGRCGG